MNWIEKNRAIIEGHIKDATNDRINHPTIADDKENQLFKAFGIEITGPELEKIKVLIRHAYDWYLDEKEPTGYVASDSDLKIIHDDGPEPEKE